MPTRNEERCLPSLLQLLFMCLKAAVIHPTHFYFFFQSQGIVWLVLLYRTLFLLSCKDLRTSNISCAPQPARRDLWERWSTAGFDGLWHAHFIWWLWWVSPKSFFWQNFFHISPKVNQAGSQQVNREHQLQTCSPCCLFLFFFFLLFSCGLAWKFLLPWHLWDFSSPGLNRSCPSSAASVHSNWPVHKLLLLELPHCNVSLNTRLTFVKIELIVLRGGRKSYNRGERTKKASSSWTDSPLSYTMNEGRWGKMMTWKGNKTS